MFLINNQISNFI